MTRISKIVCAVLVAVAGAASLIFAVFPKYNPPPASPRFPAPPVTGTDSGTFTLLWYVNGSNLESGEGEDYGGAFTRNLQDMMSALPPDDRMSVVIFTGGTKKWETEGFQPGVNQLHYITKDGLTHGDVTGDSSIGDPSTLAAFIELGMRECPADRYGLIFWDHGGGVPIGFGYDELREPRQLNMRDLGNALDSGLNGTRLAFIGFDACLMATAETAAICASYADYLISSEELEPNYGWSYNRLMAVLGHDPTVDTAALGIEIADSFYNDSLARNRDDTVTLSVVDLSKINTVVNAVESFATAVREDLERGGFEGISRVRAGVKYYGGADQSVDMVDVVHFAQSMAEKHPEVSAQLIAAVENCVVYSRSSPSSPNSNGLSIYFPLENEDIFENSMELYLDCGFTESYARLVQAFAERLKAGDSTVKQRAIPVRREKGRFVMDAGYGSDIISAEAVLVSHESDTVFGIMSYLPNVTFDEESGRATASWPQSVLHIGGVPACAANESADGGGLLSAECMVNDREMRLIFEQDGSSVTLLGAVPDESEDDTPAPGYLPITEDDVLTLKYPRVDIASGNEEDGFYTGDSFSVASGIDARFQAVPAGRYGFCFYVTDVYDNRCVTEIIDVTVR